VGLAKVPPTVHSAADRRSLWQMSEELTGVAYVD
jgi:hypothetical protein